MNDGVKTFSCCVLLAKGQKIPLERIMEIVSKHSGVRIEAAELGHTRADDALLFRCGQSDARQITLWFQEALDRAKTEVDEPLVVDGLRIHAIHAFR